MAITVVKKNTSYNKGEYRSIFDFDESERRLKIYLQSGLKVSEVVAVGTAKLEREEFCASKFTFDVLKDGELSFSQGDAVSVKFDAETIFFGYVFSKSRDKDEIISVVAYDQMRYLKNRRTYTRGALTLDEAVVKIANEYLLRTGEISKSSVKLSSFAADNVSLLDVIQRGAKETYSAGGGRYMLYDDKGYLMLKNENDMTVNLYIDSSTAENYKYTDSIDSDVYNMVEVYNDTPRISLRTMSVVSDKETMKKWGTLILSKKADDPLAMESEAKSLLKKYDRVNREIVLKGAAGNAFVRGGSGIYVNMKMEDLSIEGRMRVKKAVHTFENNIYTMDVYLDGSEV